MSHPAGPANEDSYFSLFGIPEAFALDLKDLESRFYRLSREFHPDRFSTASAEIKQESLRKMSLINEAYQTLRDQDLRRDYILTRAGLKSEGAGTKPAVPMELAEEWFEIQDAFSEDPGSASLLLERFEARLSEAKKKSDQDLRAIERVVDQQGIAHSSTELKKMVQLTQLQSYFASLARDIARLKGRSGSLA